jgi:hypothetical protein
MEGRREDETSRARQGKSRQEKVQTRKLVVHPQDAGRLRRKRLAASLSRTRTLER